MTSKRGLLGATGLLVLFHSGAHADQRFDRARVYLERNLLDDDSEAKFEAAARDTGLATLKIIAPDERTVVDFRAPASDLGIRQLTLETPEPKNDGKLGADFPAGTNKFKGTTTGGIKMEGEATLSHKFPPATSFIRPRPDEKNVPITGLRVRWKPVRDLTRCVIVIEDESTGSELRVDLPGSAIGLGVPDGFLLPNTEYKLAVGTVSKEGNISFVETTFTTIGKR